MYFILQVLGATLDGNSVNRRLVKLHQPSADLVYKVMNPFAEKRFLYFSDPPHLIKTVRNCWLSKHRNLWVCTYYSESSSLWLTLWFIITEWWMVHIMESSSQPVRARHTHWSGNPNGTKTQIWARFPYIVLQNAGWSSRTSTLILVLLLWLIFIMILLFPGSKRVCIKGTEAYRWEWGLGDSKICRYDG